MPERIQLRRAKDWSLPEGAVNCARPGPWGNPFVVGRNGTRAECVELFELMLTGNFAVFDQPNFDALDAYYKRLRRNLAGLRGRDLACWCPLDGGPCHASVLLELANR